MPDKEFIQELTEIVLNINEAEYNEDITAEQAKEAREALLTDAAMEAELQKASEK